MWQTMDKEDVLTKFRVNSQKGLSNMEVQKRQKKYGKNSLKEKKKESLIIRFVKQFNDFMIIILIIASALSAGIAFFNGENDYFDSIIIIVIVVLNAIMSLIQETKAEKSIESLKKLTPSLAKVVRNGVVSKVESQELVPGDIIILEAGNFVPADARLIKVYDLKVEESSLTGESESIAKSENIVLKKDDNSNMVFMGTIVVNGHAKAVVTEIGMETKVGKIADMIDSNDAPLTPLQKKLEQVGKILGIVCLAICAFIFIIGLIRKIEPVEMFMTSVGLAVAAIPEGMPAIVTIMLSIGVTRMANKNSIIRKLPAVETLGSSNVICSDKTGTLTQNKMEVKKVDSYDKNLLIELGAMCNDCDINIKNGISKVDGEATEIAIVNYGLKYGKNKNELYSQMERISEIPFDSNRKMMTTLHRKGASYRVVSKGAPDVLLNKCKYILKNGEIKEITISDINEIKQKNLDMAKDALRVLAIAYSDINNVPIRVTSDVIEKDLIYVGLVGMIDPPKEGVKEAVTECKKAGIKTVMITGDHIATAIAIAKELGILKNESEAITGKNLDNMTQKELEKVIKNYSVFARVTPEHKVRIVKAWQTTGAVVAMTGDGVNDSPALKNADIGIAMGKTGTDVAKNAADMILTDDNFATIVEAVKQGRNIYDNIKKAIHFLISTNIGEIVTILMGLVLGFKSPLLALQLIWINLVTDSFPAIAIGLEKPEKDIMKRKPIDARKSIFADGMFTSILLEGILIGALTLIAFSIGNKYYSLEVGRTMAFVALGTLELVHSFNIKSEKSILKSKILDNKFLIGSFALGIAMQVIVVVIPTFANIFQLVPLNITQWIITAIISIILIPIMEIQKVKKVFTKKEKCGKIAMLNN